MLLLKQDTIISSKEDINMAKKYIVHAGWFDDLNFKYVYPDRQEFDNKEDADAYTKSRLESGFNVKREEIDT